MKNKIQGRTWIFLFILGSGLVFLNGCLVNSQLAVSPVTVPDIIRMSKDSLSSKAIINEIRKSHTAYALKATEFAKLQKDGVADSVINFMQKTHLNLVRQQQRMEDSYYWYPGYYNWGYGYSAFGWPYWGWNMRPPIIHGGGGFYRGGGVHRGGGDRR